MTLFKSVNGDDRVTLYYPRHKVKPVEFDTSDILVRYENVKTLFTQILTNWLTASEVAKRARRMVLSSEQRPSAFIELRFLPLAHAAEVLTKESNSPTFVEDATFAEIRNQMLASLSKELPKELIDSIKSSLGWANGRNVKSKLLTILNGLQDETCRLFCIDKTKFIAGIVDTRNYYTHYSAKKNLLQGVDLHWAIRKASSMLRILLLIKAGVPESDLRRLVHSHGRLSQKRAVWSRITEEGSPLNGAESG